MLLPKVNLILFDFAGSGYSEGEYITLGVKEARDTRTIIDYAKQKFGINKVILWGRSMGAVTAILFAAEEKNKNLV